MDVLLDSNVILDAILSREPWVASAATIWQAHVDGVLVCHVTASSITDIYYIVGRQTDATTARQSVRACLDTLHVLPVDGGILERAYQLNSGDFEDDVQIACAVAEGLDAIVTRDPRGFVDSPVPVLSPDELLRRLGIPTRLGDDGSAGADSDDRAVESE